MKGRRHTPEQVVRKLHKADKLVGQSEDLAAGSKHLEIPEQTYYRWRKRYGELSGLVTGLDRIVTERGAPGYLRCDNGRSSSPGPVWLASVLRGGHRVHRARLAMAEPYVESFNARVRDELLNMTESYTLHEAEVLIADFQMDYNSLQPHSSPHDQAPAMFAER